MHGDTIKKIITQSDSLETFIEQEFITFLLSWYENRDWFWVQWQNSGHISTNIRRLLMEGHEQIPKWRFGYFGIDRSKPTWLIWTNLFSKMNDGARIARIFHQKQ